MTKTKEGLENVSRTSAGLRDALFDEIDALRSGSSNPTRANAVAKLASGVVDTVRMELDVQKHLERRAKNATPINDDGLGAPLKLSA